MKAPIFILIFLLSTSATQAQKVLDLQGTIGKLPVYFHLEVSESTESTGATTVQGSYFYETSLKDIVLQGTKNGDEFSLYLNQDGRTFDERCVISPEDDGTFTGTWTSNKGKTLPVSLKELDASKFDHPYKENGYVRELRKNDVFNYARTSFIKLRRDSTTNLKSKLFVWFSETHCNASLFRLGNGFAKETNEIINPKLDSIHFLNIIRQLTCASYKNYSTGKDIYYETRISYLDEKLLGFNIFSYYDCGGAYPDGGSEGYLIDLHSGKQYSIDEILSFHSSVVIETEKNFEQFSNYREQYFAPQLLQLETAAHHFTKPKTEDDCDYTDAEVWQFPSWNFTEKGIKFTPGFPHVMAMCREDFLVPFSALRPYKNPKFPYSF